MPGPDLVLLGHIVKFNPVPVLTVHDAFGPEDAAVRAGVQGGENRFHSRLGEGLGRLPAPRGEYLVGVVVMAGAVGVGALMAVVVSVVMFVMVAVVPVVVLVADRKSVV